MKDLTPLEEYRVKNAKLVSISFYGGDRKYNGVFRVRLKTYRWFNVIATNGGGWDHVSVSPYNHAKPLRGKKCVKLRRCSSRTKKRWWNTIQRNRSMSTSASTAFICGGRTMGESSSIR